jgi:hypothetical protein
MDYTQPVRRTHKTITILTTPEGEKLELVHEHVRTMRPYLDRLLALTEKGGPGECWEWVGTIDKRSGYGRMRFEGRTHLAHRASYIMHVGPIPDGKYLDHLCRNRSCVNPEHLEPVTPQVNVDRGAGAKRDECTKGHSLKGENKGIRSDGRQYCKQCSRDRQRKHQMRNVR